MRGPKTPMLVYLGMIALPIMLFLYAIVFTLRLGDPTPFELLAGVALIVFNIASVKEIYLSKKASLYSIKKGLHSSFNSNDGDAGIGEEIEVRVKRFDNWHSRMDQVTYRVKVGRYTSVLNALLSIKSKQDNTLSVRYSCNMGICGSCGMEVNGKPSLACETNALRAVKGGCIEVGPMTGHPLLKDLVNNMGDMFEKHKTVAPGIVRKDQNEKYASGEAFEQSQGDIEKFLPYSYCIMCGLCLDACPVVNSNPNFVGPQALSQAYRYHKDNRDQMGGERLDLIDKIEGVWGCEFAGSCTEVCPKGVGCIRDTAAEGGGREEEAAWG